MIITIAGRAGSGKSTVAKMLAKELGYTHYSTGDIVRAMAKERGITLEELMKLSEKTPDFDKHIDAYQKELGKKEDNFVLDGRLGWYFIPHSKKIFLEVSPEVAAKRIFKDKLDGKRNEQAIQDIHEALICSKERDARDAERYKKIYGFLWDEPKNFDLVIDTSIPTAEEIVKKIKENIIKMI